MGLENNEQLSNEEFKKLYSIDFQWSEDGKALGVKREDIGKFRYSKSLEGHKGEKGDRGTDGFCWRPKVDANGNISWTNDNSTSKPLDMNIKGPQGIQGIQGVKGNTGATGSKGDKGDIGICWRPSIDGNGNVSWISSTVTTAPPTVNVRGPQGIQGIKGVTGAQGIQGPKGDTGLQGPKGDTGARGATGAVGPAGKDGTRIIVSNTQPASISAGSIWIQVI